jgi:hypothetical protein
MRLRWMPLLCGLALLCLPAVSRAADNRAGGPDLPRLLDQLGSSDFGERETASRALLDAGAAALPGLRRAAASQDPEVRRRASDLLRLVERRAEAARLLQPKQVRLVFRDTPVPEAVAEFARQTGFPIQLEGDTRNLANRRITLDTGAVPFWSAYDQFCGKAGVADPVLFADGDKRRGAQADHNNTVVYGRRRAIYYNSPNQNVNIGHLELVDGRAPELPTCLTGAVRVRVLPPHVPLPPVLLGSEERLLGLEVFPEPDLAWQGVIALHVTRAIDDRGRPLTQPLPYLGSPVENERQYGFVRVWDPSGMGLESRPSDPRHIPVRLRVGPSGARLIRDLEGRITAQVQTPLDTLLRIDDVTRSVGTVVPGRHGGWLKVIAVSRDAGGAVKVHGQMVYPPSEEAPPSWMTNGLGGMNQMVFFMGPNGNMVEVPNLELRDSRGIPFHRVEQNQGMPAPVVTDSKPHEFHLTFQQRPGQTEPMQLVFIGRRTLLVDIPFSLRDVALP